MPKIKITVFKRLDPKVVFGKNVPKRPTGEEIPVCERFQDGQEFIIPIQRSPAMPEGFCSWAWHDIYKDLSVLWFGGEFFGRGNMMWTCCTDGVRPVIFKIERLSE